MPKFDLRTAIVCGWLSLVFLLASTAQAVTIVPGDLIVNKNGGVVVHLDPVTLIETPLYSNANVNSSPVTVVEDGGFVLSPSLGGSGFVLHVDPLTGVTNSLGFLGSLVPHQFAVDRSINAFKRDGDEDLLMTGKNGDLAHEIWRVTAPFDVSVVVSGLLDNPLTSGVAVEADGQIVTTGPQDPGQTPVVLRVDPDTGAPTTLASGAPMDVPNGIDVEADGQLIVSNKGRVVRVNPATAGQTELAQFDTLRDVIVDRRNGDLIVNDTSGLSRFDSNLQNEVPLLGADDFRRVAVVPPWVAMIDATEDPSNLPFNGGSTKTGGVDVTFDASADGSLNMRYEKVPFAGINEFLVNPEVARPGFAIAGTDFQIWLIEYAGVINGQAVFVFGYDDTVLGSVMETELVVWQYFDDQGWVPVPDPATNVSIDTGANTITVLLDVIAITALGTDGACSNGIDDDGDSKIDFGPGPGNDPGCESATDISEHAPSIICDDGIDNDGDGRMDFDAATFASPGDENNLPAGVGDPACLSWDYPFENRTCSDGIDNDPGQANGLDYDGGYSAGLPAGGTPDPKCTGPWKDEVTFICGVGFELALLLPLLMVLRKPHRPLG